MSPFRVSRLAALLATATLYSSAPVQAAPLPPPSVDYSVGPQYDTTHVYVAPQDFDRFVASLIATFGGAKTKEGVFTVTPTPSQTMSQLVLTPAGTISVFGFRTPIPFPFGAERTGYLVTDLDAAIAAARHQGAFTVVESFPDPIGRDAVVQWPGGVDMQLYWHTTKPSYAALSTIPENRVYLPGEAVEPFVRDWLSFSKGRIVADERAADGAEIGKPATTFRRLQIDSGYGTLLILATNGQLPWPYGRELTGYAVKDLAVTLKKASQAGVEIIGPPVRTSGRASAMLRFPGGYIAEVHEAIR